jgi:hypothetical protein
MAKKKQRDWNAPPDGKLCPRCQTNRLYKEKVLNCLSRKDNKTYICRRCGDLEALGAPEDIITVDARG